MSDAGGVIDVIDAERDDLVALALELGNTPSPHGRERVAATKVADWLTASGLEAWLQTITAESANAVGRIRGTDDGRSLILNAHLDTGPELPADASPGLQLIQRAWLDGGVLYGYGLVNDKGQLAACMMAARALLRAGVRLRGDLIVAGVAYETGAPSVGETQGFHFPGEGFGTWWLVNRGVTADFALVAETSGFGLVTAEAGAAGLEVRMRGRHVYTPRLERGEALADNPNAVVRAAHAAVAVEEWAVDYETKMSTESPAGRIVPKAQLVRIDATPRRAVVRIDVRLRPGDNPRSVRRDLELNLRGLGLECDVELYQWSRGYVAREADQLVTAVTAAHLAILHSPPPPPPSPEISMWRDVNVFNEVGIPSICYGPPRQPETYSDAGDRAIRLDDLVAATKVYALTALSICESAG